MNTWQKIMQTICIMSGHANEKKEVKLGLSMVTLEQNVNPYASFITLTLNWWNKKSVMERTLLRNRIKHGVDIFIYPGVFIYFFKRFANLNSIFSRTILVFLKLLFRTSLKKMLISFATLLRICNHIFSKLYPEETHLLLKEIVYVYNLYPFINTY